MGRVIDWEIPIRAYHCSQETPLLESVKIYNFTTLFRDFIFLPCSEVNPKIPIKPLRTNSKWFEYRLETNFDKTNFDTEKKSILSYSLRQGCAHLEISRKIGNSI